MPRWPRQAHPRNLGVAPPGGPAYHRPMNRDRFRARPRTRSSRLADAGLDWVSLAHAAERGTRRVVPFDRSCWHTVDPGTVLFTGSLNQNIGCSGTWLAEHEYVIEDVNKWWFLARSGRMAGATSLATHGDLSRSARHRSHEAYGIGDELRGLLRDRRHLLGRRGLARGRRASRWFTEDDVRCLSSLSRADRRRVPARAASHHRRRGRPPGPTAPASSSSTRTATPSRISPAPNTGSRRWSKIPLPSTPSGVQDRPGGRRPGPHCRPRPGPAAARRPVPSPDQVRRVAAAVRHSAGRRSRRPHRRHHPACRPGRCGPARRPRLRAVRARVPSDAAVHAGGLHQADGADALALSPYTVQDHLKSIFAKTGVRSRSELVGQIFLEHYVPRWEDMPDVPTGWLGKASPAPVVIDPGPSPDAATVATPSAIPAAANPARPES